MIKIQGLNFAYNASRIVFDDLSITFGEGLNVIIGPNAAGKSTLLKCIFGLLKYQGEIYYGEKLITTLARRELMSEVAYLPQMDASETTMTAFEMVLLGRLLQLGWFVDKQDLMLVTKTMKELGIDGLAEQAVNRLSGGQQKMVAIAQTLIRAPKMIMMDEPTNSLDLQKQLELCAVIRNLSKEGISFILVLHDINLAARFADYIVVLDREGSLYAQGKPKTVITTEMLSDVYNIAAHIAYDRDGLPGIIPLYSNAIFQKGTF